MTATDGPRCVCCNQDRDLSPAGCGHLFCSSCLRYRHDTECVECDLAVLADWQTELAAEEEP